MGFSGPAQKYAAVAESDSVRLMGLCLIAFRAYLGAVCTGLSQRGQCFQLAID